MVLARRLRSIYANPKLSSIYTQERPVYNDKWVDKVLHGLGDTRHLKAVDVGAGSCQVLII